MISPYKIRFRNKTNIDWTQIAIDVYPKWVDGNITINLSADGFNGIYETVSTEIKLKGSYLINTNDDEILKNRYSFFIYQT